MSKFIFPKPADENIFEDMVCDIFSRRFQNPNMQRYGRNGQQQDGLDITGFTGTDYTESELVGIQCKNHVKQISSADLIREIEDTLKKFGNSDLQIERIYFVTSADKDKVVEDHVTTHNKKGEKPFVEVKFWDYVTGDLHEFPDLLYKYFTKYLPPDKSRSLSIADLDCKNHDTIQSSYNDFCDGTEVDKIVETLEVKLRNAKKGSKKISEYNLYIGISSKKDVNFSGMVDINIDFHELFSDEEKIEEKFKKIVSALKGVAKLINTKSFSKEVVFYTDAEITLNFLLGRICRIHKIAFKIKARDQVWGTYENLLPYVEPETVEPIMPQVNGGSDGIIAVEIRDSQTSSVKDIVDQNLDQLGIKYKVIEYRSVSGSKIKDSAHALSVAKELYKAIMRQESWGCKEIHLFLAIPKALATLVGYLINTTINSKIKLYFCNSSRDKYIMSGLIDNNTF